MKRLLPLGTVLKLDQESAEKVMIISRLVRKEKEEDQMWDYCGCIVPQGINNQSELKFFNHSDVRQLLFIGFQDEEELKYSTALSSYESEQAKDPLTSEKSEQ